MNAENEAWRGRISLEPGGCHGKPCIRGARIMVSVILDYLKAGKCAEDIQRQYPKLGREGILAAIGYAAWMAREEE